MQVLNMLGNASAKHAWECKC